ncbi:hypothetical protein FQN57_001203 [Myotisia sp. PD_48]|nr:hypothetical protein FQN57_001203 [Myotisia sp. PD_48]
MPRRMLLKRTRFSKRCLIGLPFFSLILLISIIQFFGHKFYIGFDSRFQLKTISPNAVYQSNNCTAEGSSNLTWEYDPTRDADNYGLNRLQCYKAFPKLFVEIDKAVRAREGKKIIFWDIDSREMKDAMVRAMIYHGALYVIEFKNAGATFTRGKATLNAINRALNSVPDRASLPNIEFIFSAEDFVGGPQPIWTYSKKDGDDHAWLMPDFGYWAWPEVGVGSYQAFRQRAAAIDQGLGLLATNTKPLHFSEKQKKLFWRGNVATAPELRGKFVNSAAMKPWASVREIGWGNKEKEKDGMPLSFLPLEDHCRYMFLAHIEGRSFSGRGKYLQHCRSVFVTHELVWKEVHHAALVVPGDANDNPEANYIQVNRDFSDLEAKMQFLLSNPAYAEVIAENSVRTFRDRYLTPAAEACYWRELIRQYGAMCDFEPLLYSQSDIGKPRGIDFESFILDPDTTKLHGR